MMAYLDENGNLTNEPPDPSKRKEVNLEDIQIGVARHEDREPEDAVRRGVVIFFNDSKGYGFIGDSESQQNVFVHVNNLSEAIKEKDKVTFEVEKSPRGLTAVKVKKVG